MRMFLSHHEFSYMSLILLQDEYQLVRDKEEPPEGAFKESSEEDQRLKNAATIGTALMVVNSHRALVIM